MTETHGRSTAGQLLSIIASGWARLGITFVAGLIITALLISEFGLIRFGMFIFILQVTDLTLYACFSALSRSMIRDFSAFRARGDSTEFRRVFSCGVVISVSLFLLIAAIGWPFQALGVLILDYAPELHSDLRSTILATALGAAFYLGITPWQAMVISAGKILQLNAFMLANRLCDLVAVLVVMQWGIAEGFVAFVWLRTLLRVGVLTALALYGRSRSPDARFSPRLVSGRVIRSLFRTGGWAMSIPVSQYSFYELDQLLLNLFVGPIYNAIYGVSNQVRGYARLAGSSIILGTDALASDLHEQGRIDTVRNVLDATIRFPLVITGCCAILLGVFAEPVLTVWLADSIAEGSAPGGPSPSELIEIIATFAIVTLIGTVVAEPHYAAASVLYGMGHLRRFSPLMFGAAIAKPVIAAGLLAFGFAPISAIIVTVVIQILLYGVYFPWLIADVSRRSVAERWRTVDFRPGASLAIFLGIALSVRATVSVDSVVSLATVLAVTSATYEPLGYFLALNPNERERLLGMIAGRLGRARRRSAPGTVAGQPTPAQPPGLASMSSETKTPR